MNTTSLKSVLDRRVFDGDDLKGITIVEKVRMHLLDPDHIHLKPNEREYFDDMNRTFHLLSENYRNTIVVAHMKSLMPKYNSSRRYQLIKDAQELYSSIVERNLYFDKIIQRERVIKHMEFCDKTNRIKELIGFEKLLIEIDKEIKTLQRPADNPNTRVLPAVTFSADPSTLHQSLVNLNEDEEE